jgi:hypothetical protein
VAASMVGAARRKEDSTIVAPALETPRYDRKTLEQTNEQGFRIYVAPEALESAHGLSEL